LTIASAVASILIPEKAGSDLFFEGLAKRTGMPAVMFDGDMVDERFYAQAEVNSRIETLMALLEGAKDK